MRKRRMKRKEYWCEGNSLSHTTQTKVNQHRRIIVSAIPTPRVITLTLPVVLGTKTGKHWREYYIPQLRLLWFTVFLCICLPSRCPSATALCRYMRAVGFASIGAPGLYREDSIYGLCLPLTSFTMLGHFPVFPDQLNMGPVRFLCAF